MILTTLLLMMAAVSLLTFFRMRNKRVEGNTWSEHLKPAVDKPGHTGFEEEKAAL